MTENGNTKLIPMVPISVDLFRDDQAGWTKKIIVKLKGLQQKSWDYTWIHRENSGYLNDLYDWLSVGSFVLSFLNGGILLFRTNLIYIQVFTIVLSFGTGLLQFFIKFKNYPELIEKHKMASSRFSSIYNNIERQLSLPVNMRQNPLHFHQWISQQFDTLFATAPDIDGPVIDKYRSILAKLENGKNRHSYALEADHFEMTNDSSSGDEPVKQSPINSVPEMNSISSIVDSITSEDYSSSQEVDAQIEDTTQEDDEPNVNSITDSEQNRRPSSDSEQNRRPSLNSEQNRRFSSIQSRRRSSLQNHRRQSKLVKNTEELVRAKSQESKKNKRGSVVPDRFLDYQKGRFDANLMMYPDNNYNLNNKCLMDDVVMSSHSNMR